jgi:hypothetical protein
MTKTWGFQKVDKRKQVNIFKLWKASIFLIIFTICFSFFSFTNDVVHASKTSLIEKLAKFSQLSFLNKNNIPSQIADFILAYKNWKNILSDKYKPVFLFTENHLSDLISILWYWAVKNQLVSIYKQFSPYKKDIFKLLGKEQEKRYLIIFENIGEERPDGGFFGSFAEVSFSGGHLKDWKVIDSYKIIFDQCQLTGSNWYKNCDRTKLHIKHNLKKYNKLFTYTSFLNSNYFWFTELNWKNIIVHYKKAYPNKKINWVIFVKSNILKYLLVDGEKISWKMEMINYKNLMKKKKWLLKKWIKDEYLTFVKQIILSKKKDMFINFVKNYDKIRENGLIRVYLPEVTDKFQKYLKENNFVYYNDNKSAYLFFYNVGNNKASKFVDHVVTVNKQVLINPLKIPLQIWKNIISYKNVFNEKIEYYDLLKQENIEKESFLWWKDTEHYDKLLIVPDNCKKYSIWRQKYLVECR